MSISKLPMQVAAFVVLPADPRVSPMLLAIAANNIKKIMSTLVSCGHFANNQHLSSVNSSRLASPRLHTKIRCGLCRVPFFRSVNMSDAHSVSSATTVLD